MVDYVDLCTLSLYPSTCIVHMPKSSTFAFVPFLFASKNKDYKLGRGGAAAYGGSNGNRTFNSSENLLQMSNLLSDEEREEKGLFWTVWIANLFTFTPAYPTVREHTRTILLEDFPNYVRDMHKGRDAGFEEEYKVTPIRILRIRRILSHACVYWYLQYC